MSAAVDFPRDEEARSFLISRMRDVREREGQLPSAMVHHAAALLGRSERTVWRWVEGAPKERTRRPYQLTERDRELYYQLHGNVLAVWRQLHAENSNAPSRPTLHRAFASQMTRGERAYAVQGEQGWRAHTLHLRHEVDRRNEVWEADHKQLSIEVIPPRGKPIKPWVTLFLDAHSRAVMGYSINAQPSAADVIAAFRAGIVHDPDRGPFCGVPDTLVWDNGKEFLANAVTEVAVAVGCLPRPTKPFSPHLKGKIERFNRTLEQSLLSGLPGYVHGARKANGKLYGGAERIALEEFVELFEAFIRDYNLERQHAGLDGRTPLEMWQTDASPLKTIPEEKLRWMLLPSKELKVHKDGVHWSRHIYVAPELHELVGEKVQIRYMPHDHRKIDVYRDGNFIATAVPHEALGDADTRQLLANRDASRRRVAAHKAAATRKAKVRYAPITQPGASQNVTRISRIDARNAGAMRVDRDPVQEDSLDLLKLDGLNEPVQDEERSA